MKIARGGLRVRRVGLAIALVGCGQAQPTVVGPFAPAPLAQLPSSSTALEAGAPETPHALETSLEAPEPDAGARVEAVAEGGQGASCPTGMILVDTSYCPVLERRCADEEYSPQNKLVICHRYAIAHRCLAEMERRRFCIDEYEFPNQKGAHPPWMVSWYDAQASCASVDKRLCYESEWVSACEGPDKLPFPYGYVRDSSKCNIDNQWIQPSLPLVYNKDPEVQSKELSRLDQSVASGSQATCVSGFGVHDMTGNFDEWVTADARRDDKSEWAALKGGAWGHVRNACRPATTSHAPDFTYYFIAFRCCKDAPGGPSFRPKDGGPPDVEPADRAPIPSPVHPAGPSSTKVAREHWPFPSAVPETRHTPLPDGGRHP